MKTNREQVRGTNIETIQKILAGIRSEMKRLQKTRPGLVDGESDDRILRLCKDIELIQKASDILLSQMSQADRLYFKEKMPTALAILGWAGCIDNDGRVVHDA